MSELDYLYKMTPNAAGARMRYTERKLLDTDARQRVAFG
jgi:hypothetical protein